MAPRLTDQADRPLRAALWMIGAILSFSAMAVAGREVSVELDTFELMTYRSLIGVMIVTGIGALTGRIRTVSRANLGTHLMRNIAHFTGQNLWFFAVTAIPLAQVFALEFTSPLWVILLAPLFLGERLTALKLAVVAAGFTGVLIVAQPGAAPITGGTIAAAAAAVAFAVTALFTKRLTRVESVTSILFYLTAMQLVFGLVMSGADGDMALPSVSMLPWVIVVGLGGLTAHFCITTALTLAPASVVMPIDFVRLPAIAIAGMVLYGEALQWPVFLGAAIIFGANYVNVLAESRAGRRRV